MRGKRIRGVRVPRQHECDPCVPTSTGVGPDQEAGGTVGDIQGGDLLKPAT